MVTLNPEQLNTLADLKKMLSARGGNSDPFIITDPNLGSDPQYEAQVDALRAALAGLVSNTDLQVNRNNQDFLLNKFRLDELRGDVTKSLQERLADQGILRSGINVAEQGKIGEKYQQDLGDLNRSSTRTLEDLFRNLTTGRENVLAGQRGALADRISRFTQAKLQAAQDAAMREANEAMQRRLSEQNDLIRRQTEEARQAQQNLTVPQLNLPPPVQPFVPPPYNPPPLPPPPPIFRAPPPQPITPYVPPLAPTPAQPATLPPLVTTRATPPGIAPLAPTRATPPMKISTFNYSGSRGY